MPSLKVLSGKDIIKIFEIFGFTVKSQRGSHVKLKRQRIENNEILIIPDHKNLKKGTLISVYKKGLEHGNEKDLRPYFYND